MKKSSVIVISGVCGFLASVATYILIAWAAQTWPVTTSTTGHQTDHLTNIVQRDDALRSNFSGASAPSSPVPGQNWFDTDDSFMYFRNAGDTAWLNYVEKDQTQTLTNKTLDTPIIDNGITLTGDSWPCFSVSRGGTGQVDITSIDKVEWITEDYDTNSNFDNATNYRFTPTVAGKYLFNIQLAYTNTVDGDDLYIFLYKNGSEIRRSYADALPIVDGLTTMSMNVQEDANGSTDYYEVFARNQQRNTSDLNGVNDYTFWMGCRIG